MKPGIHVQVLWSDADVFKIRVSAWNGAFGGSVNAYVAIGGLRKAAAEIAGFPKNSSDIRELLFGNFGSEWAGGAVRVHFYCKDAAGHAFITASLESDFQKGEKAESVTLFGAVEAAAVDDFVMQLKQVEAEQYGSAFLRIGDYVSL
ncbi:MAG TPA: hypothetical protein VJQ59_06895 [Candidatus Sulfotelmatobacter sp.]|nr:hypothetical protein [Candidatus Sulfotelmatobacter sp.]